MFSSQLPDPQVIQQMIDSQIQREILNAQPHINLGGNMTLKSYIPSFVSKKKYHGPSNQLLRKLVKEGDCLTFSQQPGLLLEQAQVLNNRVTFDFRIVEERFWFASFQIRFPPKLDKHRGWFCNVDIFILWSFEDNGKLQDTKIQMLE